MSLTRRHLLAASAAAALTPVWAQDTKPLRVLVGFPPGGGTDAIARLLADKLKDLLGRTVVVENRAGAGGQLAAQTLKSAPADGSTVFITHDHTISILPQVMKNPGFDPDKDFVAVGGFVSFVNCFAVSGGTPAKSFDEYVAWVKTKNDGKSAVGIPAPASTPEFLVKLIGQRYRLDLVAAPYRGSGPLIADMLGNQIPAGIGSVPDFIENHRAGKLRVVAVLGTQRQAQLPDVPTFDELGVKGFEDLPYYGFFAPKGTPEAFAQQFSAALAKVVQMPEVHQQLTTMGLTVEAMTPTQLSAREHAYTAAWKRIIEQSGFKPQ